MTTTTQTDVANHLATTAPAPETDAPAVTPEYAALEDAAREYVPLGDFMNDNPAMSISDLLLFLNEPPAFDPSGYDEGTARAGAMAAVSSVLHSGVGGAVVSALELGVGDEIDLAGLWSDEFHSFDKVKAANSDYLAVVSAPWLDDEGTVTMKVQDSTGERYTFTCPDGTVVPAVGFDLDGKAYSVRRAAKKLSQAHASVPGLRRALHEFAKQHPERSAGFLYPAPAPFSAIQRYET